ncbi:VOC family protein [Aquimarina aquimarini]|uniref:VOC family protein n=1 Tax=Aquimarina aquimarini TaxID=1191734 RepID=UPI001F29B94F|nr:VOC family protein [Aquimarina aquimarini]
MKNNLLSFHHYSIKAYDFEKTIEFYNQLGFQSVHHWSLPEFDLKRCEMLYNEVANTYIEICDRDANFPTQGRKRIKGEEFVENSIMHICFGVKDAQKAFDFAISRGGKALSPKTTLALNSGKKSITVTNSLVYSPNGEVIEFLEVMDLCFL